MALVSDETMREDVRRILKGADLESISERKIKNQIAEKHGDVGPFKDLIREEVEAFLESVRLGEGEEDVKPAVTKRKASGDADSEPQAKAQKKAHPSGKATVETDGFLAEDDEKEEDEGDTGGSNGLPIKLSSNRRANVSEFKGTTLVNIREYYEKDRELLPGKKGISLSPEQFNILKESAANIQTALEAEDTEYNLPLSSRRSVRINVFKGTAMVDIREMYEKDGEERPGKKGISLNIEQWAALKQGLNKLNSAL